MEMKEANDMWIPYVLGLVMVYFTITIVFESIDEAKQNEYKSWGFHDGPVPLRKMVRSFAGGIFLMFCMKYEFSTRVCLVCMTAVVGLTVWLSWVRWQKHQKWGQLIVSIVSLIGAVVMTWRFWDQFPM